MKSVLEYHCDDFPLGALVDDTLLATFPCCCSHGRDMTHLQQAAGDQGQVKREVSGASTQGRWNPGKSRAEQGEQDCSVGWFLHDPLGCCWRQLPVT